MLKWNNRHMISFAEEKGHQWFFHKQLSLDLARFQWLTRCTVALFRAHTHRSMIRHLWRSYKRLLKHRHRIFGTFLCTNRHEPFFERLSNCAGSNENKSFLRPGVHALLNVCCWKKCPRMPLSHGTLHKNLALSVLARHQCFLVKRLFLEDLHGIRLWASYDWITTQT